jgi:hypothetical protein
MGMISNDKKKDDQYIINLKDKPNQSRRDNLSGLLKHKESLSLAKGWSFTCHNISEQSQTS